MQFTVASLIALAASGASALPHVARQDGAKVGVATPFTIQATFSGPEMQFPYFYANNGEFTLNNLHSSATCTNPARSSSAATFTIDAEGNMYLYATQPPVQQTWVDRSGMGQGNIGYTSAGLQGPKNGERTGWAIDDSNNLTFNGVGFIGCPKDDGSWRIWVNAGVDQPAGNQGCVPVGAIATAAAEPNDCHYSDSA
ncbi:cell wall protein PhiA [Biscogniauxia mediterranea]|nr:cell wall protein PhiA [Biscogniauxia mediterranea]